MKHFCITSTFTKNLAAQALIEGDLVIRDSEEIKEELLSLLKDHQRIEIHFKNIRQIDVAALQLLVALSNSAYRQQKTIKYNFEQTEYINNVLNISGFNSFLAAR